MEAIKIKARIDDQQQLVLLEPTTLRAGEVEIIVLYINIEAGPQTPKAWPVLQGGRYLGGTLRREEIYNDAR